MNNTLRLALTLTAISLLPVACTIETTKDNDNDNVGGINGGGATSGGASAIKGGTANKGGSTSGGAATGGTKAAAGSSSVSVAGASATAGSPGIAGAATSGGATNTAGSNGTTVTVAGTTGVATTAAGAKGIAGAPATGGAGVTGGTTGTAGGANVAGAAGATQAIVRTRVDVTDDITTATTWTSDHVYVLTGQNYVSAALTIQPGTIVKFGADAYLNITPSGQLNAVGSADAHIVFTSIKDDSAGGDTNADASATTPVIGDWDHVRVEGNSSSFDYVEFRYADSLQLYGAHQSVKHSMIAYNTHGLNAASANPLSTVITGNAFFGNVSPIGVPGSIAVDSSNVFHNPALPTERNTFQSIDITDDIANTVTWSNIEVAYVLKGQNYVSSPAALTLTAGVVVKFGAGAYLRVQTGATLNGTAAAYFTSYKDDSKLGDANGDGAATTPAADDWETVEVDGDPLVGANVTYGAT